jgi:hypothetical protein
MITLLGLGERGFVTEPVFINDRLSDKSEKSKTSFVWADLLIWIAHGRGL